MCSRTGRIFHDKTARIDWKESAYANRIATEPGWTGNINCSCVMHPLWTDLYTTFQWGSIRRDCRRRHVKLVFPFILAHRRWYCTSYDDMIIGCRRLINASDLRYLLLPCWRQEWCSNHIWSTPFVNGTIAERNKMANSDGNVTRTVFLF